MKILLVFGLLPFLAACSSAEDGAARGGRADHVTLGIRCGTDSDCLTGFECEIDTEQGDSMGFCRSHESPTTAFASSCPPGFELDMENGSAVCKSHDVTNESAGVAPPSSSSARAASAGRCGTEREHGGSSSGCDPHTGSGKRGKKN